MDMQKGVVKGAITLSIIFLIALALFFVAQYIFNVLAAVSLNSNNVGIQANATFDTNQTGIDINLTVQLGNMTGLGVPVQAIDINLSEAGFANITTTNLRCPNNNSYAAQPTWNASSPTTGVLRCNITSANATLEGTVQIRILGLTARSSPGTVSFNVSAKRNSSILLENSTLVTVTIKELQASASVNDTNTTINLQRSYNFTITNNATDPTNFDSIDEIRIDYTGSGFPDTDGANVTCPKIPPTTGVQWDKVVDNSTNVIRCSKPTGTGSELEKGQSTNIAVDRWGASPIAQTRRFTIIVNGSLANGTYTVANESSPTVQVNGTITVTGTSVVPATVAVNATNITVIRYNFTTVGEAFNVSLIKVTRGGSATDNDVISVRLINDTGKNSTFFIQHDQIGPTVNTTTAGQYVFSGLTFVVNQNQSIFVVVNINSTATAGRTFNFNINASSDINSLGGSSGANVTETINTAASNNATIHGRLTVNGFNLAPTTKVINTANLAMVYFEFNATGEGMNLTAFNLTRTGSATDSDVVLVRLFNDTNANAAFDSGTDVQLGPAQNTSSAGAVYNFTGFQYNVSSTAGSVNRIIVVINISSATGGRTFSFGLNRTGDLNVTGATTGEVFTGSSNISFVGAQSGTTTIHGTLSVTGKVLNPNTTAISTAGLAVLLLNFTASGETINITQITITRTGSVTDPDGIFNVSLYNDTDRSGTFNSVDLVVTNGTANALNVTTAGGYIFLTLNGGNGYNVTTAGSSLLVVVTTNSSNSTGGKTFNLSLNSTASIQAFATSSFVNLTGSSNITLTTTNGNLTTIFGTLEVAGSGLTPATANDGQLDVPILNLTFTATGEQMNITQLNISMVNTNNDDVSAVKLYNDTDRSGSINAGDFLIATATKSGSIARFGTGTSQLFNVTAGADKRLIVAYDINTTATGGNTVDANLSVAGDVLVTGSSSALSITITGTPINPAGNTQIADLAATAVIDFLNTKVTASDNYNFTIENTGGESINSIMIDYTASEFVDPPAGNLTCDRGWTATITAALNTLNCTGPGSGGNLGVGGKFNITVKNFQAPTSAGNKTFTVQVRGTSGGFFNVTTNGVTVSGLLNVTGANQIASTVVVNSRNVSVIRYNFTASGEQMNITVIKLTRAGTAREADVVSVKLFNDTNADGSYTATTDTTQIGTTQTSNNTASQYEFTGLTFTVPTGPDNIGNRSLFAVVEIAGTIATGGKTLILNLNATGDTNAVGSTTGVNITENLTGTASTSSTIFGNLTITGKNLVNSTVAIGTETSVLQLNFTAVGEQMDISMINISVIGTATENNLTNVRLMNDTNANGVFDSSDTQIGAQLNGTTGSTTFKFTTIAFNVSAGSDKTLFVVVNTSTATGTAGKTFNLSLALTADINTFTPSSGQNITEVLVTTTSNQATIGGSFSITGKSLASNSTINTGGISVLQLNFSATNEGMNITVIKITRKGSAVDGDIFNVTLYRDADSSGTFNAPDLRLGNASNTTTASQYVFTGFQLNISTTAGDGNNTLLVIVSTNSTAGKTFNLSLASSDDINSIGAVSAANMTETLTTTSSTTENIFGTLTITGKALNGNTTVNTANFSVIQLNFTAAGEAMNVSMINISLTGTAIDTHVTNVRLINDTNSNGQFDASDTQIGPTINQTTAGGFKFTLLSYFVPTTGTTLIVVVNTTSNSSAGGKTFNLSLTAAVDINTIGAVSALNISETLTNTAVANITTIRGTLTITGNSLAASTVSMNSANITVLGLNFTAVGEQMNITVIKITRKGSATDTDILAVRLINDTDSSGTFSSGDVQLGIVVNTTTASQYIFSGFQYNVSTTPTSLLVILNTSGTSGGKTYNLSINVTTDIDTIAGTSAENITETLTNTESNTSTISGTLTITGKALNAASVNASVAGFVVIQLNFSSSGEAMNISVIKITLKGTATSNHVNNVTLYDDTDLSGTFNTGDSSLGTVGVNTTTASQYVFTGFQFNISSGGTKTLIAVVTVNGSTTAGGKTFNLSLNATGDVDTLGATSGVNISETLTTTESNTTTILGTLSIRGLDLVEADANKKSDRGLYAVPSNEANVTVLRLNFTAVGEGFNISVVKITRAAPSTVTAAGDSHMVSVRLVNDTNANGRYDGSDTQLGSALSTSSSSVYSFSGFQYNVTAGGVSTLFVVLNASDVSWTPDVAFNFSLAANADIDAVGAVTATNVTEAFLTTLTNTTRITYKGWYNITKHETGPLTQGWNSFTMPTQAIFETTGRNASNTGNFNFTTILESLGTKWTHMYYNLNGSDNGWVLAIRTNFAGSTLQFVNNTNADPYWINTTTSERLEW